MNSKVDDYINNAVHWRAEMKELQAILLECMLTEELKWDVPCYTYNGTNLIIIGAFKEFCNVSFIKGVLLQDEEGLLVAPGANSRSARYLKFTDVAGIVKMRERIKMFVFEAIEVEKAGLKIPKINPDELEWVAELKLKMDEDATFKTRFEALTTGRQRAYNLFFEAAKQSKTRLARIEKFTDRILAGKGMNDCICGHSKKMPSCDGSHKYL